ncbi:hypothetical protein L211DRAFT_679728 [Terfezia boudieri ATCC MYA-4762]|uniref:Uncharacterized protein n=1 Tax=Terfezia boudieri ATCC MYA-4762 TaxID=1051890 RepID=A0A3N4LU83_9PEZI|nr:hypothetical protein L211DRAFT_679728 [Terfezia boudieri ATCC MYA-4762]
MFYHRLGKWFEFVSRLWIRLLQTKSGTIIPAPPYIVWCPDAVVVVFACLLLHLAIAYPYHSPIGSDIDLQLISRS